MFCVSCVLCGCVYRLCICAASFPVHCVLSVCVYCCICDIMYLLSSSPSLNVRIIYICMCVCVCACMCVCVCIYVCLVCRFFHNVGRSGAYELLQNLAERSFLIRPSSRQGKLVISLNKAAKILHLLVVRTHTQYGTKYSLDPKAWKNHDIGKLQFPSLALLVSKMQQLKILAKGVPKAPPRKRLISLHSAVLPRIYSLTLSLSLSLLLYSSLFMSVSLSCVSMYVSISYFVSRLSRLSRSLARTTHTHIHT